MLASRARSIAARLRAPNEARITAAQHDDCQRRQRMLVEQTLEKLNAMKLHGMAKT